MPPQYHEKLNFDANNSWFVHFNLYNQAIISFRFIGWSRSSELAFNFIFKLNINQPFNNANCENAIGAI